MTDKKPAEPRPASTILVVRDAPSQAKDGLEVFMVVRHHQIDFASGALVFPGGKVDDGDSNHVLTSRCIGADRFNEAELGYRIAAVREVYEESGILYAQQKGDNGLLSADRLRDLEPKRQKLNANELSFSDLIASEDLTLVVDQLVPFAHWITPPMMPKRFDTWFYVAHAPEGQIAEHDGTESVDSIWISPQEALAEADAGKRTIIFPTRMNVEMLGQSRSAEGALVDAGKRNIVEVLPWTEKKGDEMHLCIPADAGYSVSSVPMSKAG